MDAATQTLTHDGTATLAQIAVAAGVGRATLHRYFPDRAALVRAIGDDALTATVTALAKARVDDGTATAALRRVVESLIALGARYGFLVLEPVLVADPEFVARDRAAMEPVARVIARARSDGRLRDELPDDWVFEAVEALCYAAWAAMEHSGITLGDATDRVMVTLEGGVFTSAPTGNRPGRGASQGDTTRSGGG